MRQTLKEIEVNFAYRWYIGYNIHEQLPHFSTFARIIQGDLRIQIYLKKSLQKY